VIDKIEIVSKGVIKRAKLYYLRDRLGKKARVQVDQTVRS
jgi:large subunit ribosomal protein L19